MMKKSFFNLTTPRFEYEKVDPELTRARGIPVSQNATLFFADEREKAYSLKQERVIKIGDHVRTGQKLDLYGDGKSCVVSPVTGTITGLAPFAGDYGKVYTAATISVEADETDDEFSRSMEEPSVEALAAYLSYAPGNPLLSFFTESPGKIKTIVISGFDNDLLIQTNQFAMRNGVDVINKTVSLLKKLTHVAHVVIALPKHLMPFAGAIGGASGAELREVEMQYPSAHPPFIFKSVIGSPLPAGKTPEDMGVCFISAEAAISVGIAAIQKKPPVTKAVTLIRKDMSREILEVRIGTPIGDIFTNSELELSDGDRIIIGGPLTGSAVYTEDYPVLPDTDAIMVQAGEDIPSVSDTPCINCGECVRICPVNVPVNMLVRFCEAGQYETAADEYDLYSCIECGLCSYVCVSRMPVFQFIKLAKYELDRARAEEARAAEESSETEAQDSDDAGEAVEPENAESAREAEATDA